MKKRNITQNLYERFYKDVFRNAAVGYARNRAVTENCASGGLVTSLLSERIEMNRVGGAMVARLSLTEESPIPETVLVENSQDLLDCAGSVYSDFNHVAGIRRIASNEDGMFDIVALPCQCRVLRKIMDREPVFKEKVGLLIGLWCGHATDIRLLKDLLRVWRLDGGDLIGFKYRKGHWRGMTEARFSDGSSFTNRFSRNYGLFQNLYADCKLRCFSCGDHFAECSDISFGDCWIRSEKASTHKKTMAVSFTDAGEEVISMLEKSEKVELQRVPPRMAVQSQKRAVIWHTYSRAARTRLGHLFRIRIRSDLELSTRINDLISAFLTLLTYRLFSSRIRPLLFRLPWWVLFPFMAFQKLMLNR